MRTLTGLGRLALPLALSAVLSVSPAIADEISDAIAAAGKSYQAGDYSTAKQSLDLASQLIAQKTAEALVAALPKALAGWKAGEADSSASGGGLGFTMTQASRSYTNAKGDSIQVQIATDSPFLAQMMTAMTNPQLAGLMGKVITIGTQRAIQTKEGEVNMLINNRFVIQVTGGGTADDKLNYAKGIDFVALGKIK